MLNRLTDTLNFQAQALNLRSERQRLLASNIANADTPGFVARDIDFAQALRAATGFQGEGPSASTGRFAQGMGPSASSGALTAPSTLSLVATQPGHVGVGVARGAEALVGPLTYAMPSQNSIDRNTVDMDRERASFADNSVKYEASLRFLNGSVRTMLDAIKGQGQ